MWFHSFLLLSNLEFVSGPERPIIQVATCLTFLDKLARIENPVVSVKPEVTIRLPAHLHERLFQRISKDFFQPRSVL